MNPEDKITYFGETDYRNKRTRFGIKATDRARHMYVIGKTGMGKSTLLENMAIQDIQNGEGMAFIDPHGGTAEKLLDYVPESRLKDVVYFAPFDIDYPISFNVMEDIGADKRHLVASGLMSSFKKIWVDAWSARMEYILNNILLALLEYPESTLLGVNRMLADKDFRKKVVENISDPSVKSFWVDEFAKYGDRYMQEAGAAIQNKIGQFTANPIIRNIIGQPHSSFDIRKLMDEKKILIMNLSKGRVGEQNAALLGGMLITKIYLAAMSRADASPDALKKLPHFYFYVDEFQSFASDSFADILSEARKYKLSLTIAHQYIEQMSDEVRAAVFGNVGTMVIFRVGATDAEVFEKEFSPVFTAEDIVNLGFIQIYLRLMINGIGSKPFSALSMPPIEKPAISYTKEIIENSRKSNARPRSNIEENIKEWHAPVVVEKPKRDFPVDGAPRPSVNGAIENNRSSQNFSQNQNTSTFSPKPVFNRPQTTPVQSTPRPFLNKTPAPKPSNSFQKSSHPPADRRPEEKKPFSGLKDLVNRIDTDDLPQENKNKTAAVVNPNIGAISKNPISLEGLKKKPIPQKEPTVENRNALKNVLAQVIAENKNNTPPPPPPVKKVEATPTPTPAPISTTQKQVVLPRMVNSSIESNDSSSDTVPVSKDPANTTVSKKPREIPEDILRKVLE
ncbi:MAG: type IV secretion system DNA-binding domain-containing protein [Candidatus Pacebacteria bacterium]|nr:type IV secretion system DNA-binding domain-containing protein [Candidatus Paceibacterota bacterium]MBP9772758.1 type IV secretion system DNA-binding domain-containing protein [Candidatus Paceibacterota bacterium]